MGEVDQNLGLVERFQGRSGSQILDSAFETVNEAYDQSLTTDAIRAIGEAQVQEVQDFLRYLVSTEIPVIKTGGNVIINRESPVGEPGDDFLFNGEGTVSVNAAELKHFSMHAGVYDDKGLTTARYSLEKHSGARLTRFALTRTQLALRDPNNNTSPRRESSVTVHW